MGLPNTFEIERGENQEDTERLVRKWQKVKSARVKVFVDPRLNRIYLLFTGSLPGVQGLIPANMYLETRSD